VVWLEVDPPDSVLAVAPWEYILQGMVPRRLPIHRFLPVTPLGPLSIALCYVLSSEEDLAFTRERLAALIPEHLEAITGFPDELARELNVFVIGPDRSDDGLHRFFSEPKHSRVRFHRHASRMRDVDAKDAAGRIPGVQPRNPWLRWMSEILGGRPVDFFHFVCDGTVASGVGALALNHPLDEREGTAVPPIEAEELDLFLTQVGAWSASFVPMRDDRSAAGLRLLAESLARRRPGLIAVDNISPLHYQRIDVLYPLVHYLRGAIRPDLFYPWRYYQMLHGVLDGLNDWYARPLREREVLQKLTLAGSGALDQLLSGKADRWLQATQRMLEQLAASWLSLAEGGEATAQRRRGLERAARVVIEAVERHFEGDDKVRAADSPYPNPPFKPVGW